jgi:hypothetical protein
VRNLFLLAFAPALLAQTVQDLVPPTRPGLEAPPNPELVLKGRAECVVNFKGALARKSTRQMKGKPPVTVQGQQEFDINVPGEMQEYEAPNGKIQFRFVPRRNGEGATGHFKATETNIQTMKETSFTVEGSFVAGMSNWALLAEARGGEIKCSPTDVTMRGKVLASNANTLPVGTDKVPVVVATVRIQPPVAKGAPTQPPVLRFQGLSLWAMANAKAPFTVVAEAVHAGKGVSEEVNGTTRITFTLKPIVAAK